MTKIYATHASEDFNKMMEQEINTITKEVESSLGDSLVALILGGGYGRGEGAVVKTSGQEKPYNDLDFTIIVKQKSDQLNRALQHVSKVHTERIGIDVDFSRPLTLSEVQQFPHWLMWYDLLNGHIVTSGAKDVLISNVPDSLKEPLPGIEASRLLLNRGAGLLWATLVSLGKEEEEDPDFRRRNLYKCLLALGDSFMIVHQVYETPYTDRDKRLKAFLEKKSLVLYPEFLSDYTSALQFKFSPNKLPSGPPATSVFEKAGKKWLTTFLHVESVRTGKEFGSVQDYINWKGLREPEQHSIKSLPRNIVQNIRQHKICWKYTREHLFRTLPKLISAMGSPNNQWVEESKHFLELWKRYN
jgi:hypothetical protein